MSRQIIEGFMSYNLIQVLTAADQPIGTFTDFSAVVLQDSPQDARIWSEVIRAGESFPLPSGRIVLKPS